MSTAAIPAISVEMLLLTSVVVILSSIGCLSGCLRKFVGGSHAAVVRVVFCLVSCLPCSLMRWSRSARSAAVYFQLNGFAVWLERRTKASRVSDSLSRLAKSFGETTFFWMTEKKISIWFSQDAWTGVGSLIVFGWALRSRSIAALPRRSERFSS